MKKIRPFFLVLLILLVLKAMEILLDYTFGNNDGEMAIIRYFQFFVLVFYVLYLSFKIKSKALSNFILCISSFALLMGIAELVFHVLVNTLPPNLYTYDLKSSSDKAPFTHYDKDFGYRATPSHVFEKTMFFKGKKIMHCQYSMDSLSRRATPDFFKSNNNKKFACFFGCSFTYGFLLKSDQTLAAQFAKADTNFRSYNYALNGYGTQQLLSTLKMKSIQNEIHEKDGVFIYPFIDHHVRRVIGDQYVMGNFDWAMERPYYSLCHDSLILNGDFNERPCTNFLYRALNKSYALKYFQIRFPLSVDEEDIALTAKIIDESYKSYKVKFKNDNFYVLIFPGQKIKIGNYLKVKKIKVLDYSKLYNIGNPMYHIPGDNHPSALACKIIAEQLAKDIN